MYKYTYLIFTHIFMIISLASETAVDLLMNESRPAERFRGHTAAFHYVTVSHQFTSPQGPTDETYIQIRDADRVVAVFRPEQYGKHIEILGHDPETIPRVADLQLPVRWHHATLIGERITGIAYVDKWGVSGDSFDWHIEANGKTLTLTTEQRWTANGRHQRSGYNKHTYTFSCDPVCGYQINISTMYDADTMPSKNGKLLQGFEFLNLMGRGQGDPWAKQPRAQWTVSTPSLQRFEAWANNWQAGEQSDTLPNAIANGGFIGFFPATTGWARVLTRQTAAITDITFYNKTCNVWLDQHNYFSLKDHKQQEHYRIHVDWLWTALPPEATQLVHGRMHKRYGDQYKLMPRLGVLEDFEDQPVALDAASPFGVRADNLTLKESGGRQNSQCAAIKVVKKHHGYNGFIIAPQISLKAKARYRIEAWMKVSGDAQAWIQAETYEWTPHAADRLARYRSEIVSHSDTDEWTHVDFTIDTDDWDPFIDLRIIAEGDAKAVVLMDDLYVRRLPH